MIREMVSTADLLSQVPEEEKEILLQTGVDVNYMCWKWGDIANLWIKRGMPRMLTYKAVAELVGVSKSTIRNYAYVARVFEDAEREEYGVLSIEHYKIALIYRKQGDPLDVLRYAISVMDERAGSRPASVDECREVFRINGKLVVDDENPEPFVPSLGYPGFAIPIVRRINLLPTPQQRLKFQKKLKSLLWQLEHEE